MATTSLTLWTWRTRAPLHFDVMHIDLVVLTEVNPVSTLIMAVIINLIY